MSFLGSGQELLEFFRTNSNFPSVGFANISFSTLLSYAPP